MIINKIDQADRRAFIGSASALLTSFMPKAAQAQSQDFQLREEHVAGFRTVGVNFSLSREGKRGIVDGTINLNEFLQSIPELKQRKILNNELSQTYINTHPFSLTGVFGQQCAVLLIDPMYKDNPTLDALTVRVSILSADDYGKLKRDIAIMFDFTRALHDRVDWSNFDPFKLSRIAQNYKISQFFQRKFAEERDK